VIQYTHPQTSHNIGYDKLTFWISSPKDIVYFNDLPYIYYSKHILIVITISILMSQINAAKSLHNKNIVKTITTYTSRLTISHLTFHTSDLKVRRDTIRFEIINTYISLHRLNLRIIIIVPINLMLEFSIKYHYWKLLWTKTYNCDLVFHGKVYIS
jgi:hypothetical protein